MKITLEEYTNPLNLGRYAGICYGKNNIDQNKQAKNNQDEKRLAHIIGVGHLSVLRFGNAVFRIEGISRVCLAQLTRSKHLDYLVRSSRYCDETEALMLIPESLAPHEQTVSNFLSLSKEVYTQLREAGVSKQDARYILPQAQETELFVCGNYQAWKDFIKLRTSISAQIEVREVALAIEKELQQIAPLIFGEYNG